MSGYVTDNSSIYPLERLNTAETEKTYVDKLDKNAVFYLNYLPLNEYPVWPVCYYYTMQKNVLNKGGGAGASAFSKTELASGV